MSTEEGILKSSRVAVDAVAGKTFRLGSGIGVLREAALPLQVDDESPDLAGTDEVYICCQTLGV